jgi:predicted glycoside hydrolase/deacetylase ChbG (UPF0249 family)
VTTLVEALGLPAGSRAVILHVDDVGMCNGANRAYLDLYRAGAVTSGSVMVPCPWFPEIAAAAQVDRTLDLGVHLTLTSEWANYRWRPISTTSRASGLIDDDGYFPRNCVKLRRSVIPEAAEAEMRAQIDTALAAGIEATHLDTHMGAALAPELLPLYLHLGEEYRLPVLLPRDLDAYFDVLRLGAVDHAPHRRALEALERSPLPPVETFRMTPGAEPEQAEAAYRRLLTTVPEGVTFVSLHCNSPGDIETIVPPRAHHRTDEYALFGSGAPARWLAEAGIAAIGYRRLRDVLRGGG